MVRSIMLAIIYVYLFDVLLVVVFFASLRWGGRVERGVATAYLIAAAVSIVLGSRNVSSWQHLESGLLFVDCALVGVLCWYAVRYGRLWIIISAALLLLSTLGHFAKWGGVGFRQLGYALMEGASSYPTLILLGIGIWQHRRQRNPFVSSAG